MNEFDNEQKNDNQARPDYYNPQDNQETTQETNQANEQQYTQQSEQQYTQQNTQQTQQQYTQQNYQQANQQNYQQNYQQNGSGTYYTPPQSNTQENTTYHYSYTANNQNQNQNQQQNQQQDYNNNYYSQQNSANDYENQNNYYDSSAENDGKPPKKKNTAVTVIIVILVVCFVAAVVGIVVGITSDSDSSNSDTSQSENVDDDAQATLNDSEEAPLQDSSSNYTVAGVAEKVIDSCVGITVYTQQTSAYDYFYNYGQSDDSSGSDSTASSEGSGIIMSESNGKTYILTCAHVISDGDSFVVTLNDDTEYDATMVGYDSQTDIGVLSIEATGLQIAEFADSDDLVVGEQVVAIGCPGGLEFMNSVTSGYISALDRPVSSSIGYDNECIQTDAAINPGNSGGALFNMQGQVIGVNSSKIASTEYEGMGFAVPSTTAVETANSLIKVGYVEGRAKLGITYNTLTSYTNYSSILSALEELGFEDAKGTMVINSVDEESDLANKDVQQYDMIVAVNGETMTSTDVMTSVLADSAPGDTITLTIARIENNKITTFEIDCELIESKG
ncbi:MAG: trypsin-like peptidase domain-containing protein [Clostridiales bacterium]|nr:trypsin-like peptidase domain-containing protein [Clostridiales bacterium]